MAVITISRTFGSGGDEIALAVSRELGYQLFDKRLIIEAAKEAGLIGKEIKDLSEDTYQVRSVIERWFGRTTALPYVGVWPEDLTALYALEEAALSEEDLVRLVQQAVQWGCQTGNMVVVGRGSQVLLKGQPGVLHVRVDAPIQCRVPRVTQQILQSDLGFTLRPDEKPAQVARDIIHERDAASAEYIKRFYHAHWADPSLYHLVINTGLVSIAQAVSIITQLARELPEPETAAAPAH